MTSQQSRKKHWAWQRYMETGTTKKYMEYTHLRNKVRTKTTSAVPEDNMKKTAVEAKETM